MPHRKIFVLDTNVLLHDPNSLFKFQEHRIIIPVPVIDELDNFKKGTSSQSHSSREVTRLLDEIREREGTLTRFVPIRPGQEGELMIPHVSLRDVEMPSEINLEKKDTHILATALYFTRKFPTETVILVTKDMNLRILADVAGIRSENYLNDQIRALDGFRTITEILEIPARSVLRLRSVGEVVPSEIGLTDLPALRANQLVELRSSAPPSRTLLAVAKYDRSRGAYLKILRRSENFVWGIKPRNKEQLYSLHLLMDPDVQLVTIIGKAGSGKSLLSLAAGLKQVADEGIYNKMVIVRPVVSVGKEIGFLPGDIGAKMEPWLKPVYDNIEILIAGNEKMANSSKVDYLFDNGTIELAPLSFIRGRSINDAFIIIDEAQNLTRHEIKTIITRAGEGSKIVLLGDLDQIDTPYLDEYSSGLTHVVMNFRDVGVAGHVTLIRSERSRLAELAADLL